MSFRYDMRGKSSQQQAIVSQRDREEQRRKEESEKQRKEIEINNQIYEFDYESVKSELNEKELSYFTDYLQTYKETIIKEVLSREKLNFSDLETQLGTGDIELYNNQSETLYKTFQFIKTKDNVIKVVKST
ncbi:hypothetical protein SAMN04487943_101291 [Gracilibacillus orientalis]|uniref:Uncharacterized protein n=1 Tax=Gracilibacillus orientalis TaxID=334253 RepID=A0A1I4HAM2_9BACI|nr:hypothetical protein [Gracilibacillus orientalis]SFL38657.1 hypothetical protein SAMN04487943_101291 [Gracilibacillus orientalis]